MWSIVFVYKKTHCTEYLTDDKCKPLVFETIIEADNYIETIITDDHRDNGQFHIIEQYNH